MPDLRISAPSGFARILVWASDATDFRPSINGGATVPVAAQRLRACWRAMAHRRRRFALLAIPLTPMLAHIWTRGDRRDRFSTIVKRRCDCAGGRAQAASVSASDGAPAHAACRLARFGKLALQLAPVACTHECNSHLCTLMTSQTVRDPSKDCFHGQFWMLTRECRARATRRAYTRGAYTHPIGHIHLVQRISTLGIEGREDRWSGDSGPSTANERRRNLTAIRELAR